MGHICQKVQKMILIRKNDQNSTFDRYLIDICWFRYIHILKKRHGYGRQDYAQGSR